MAYGSDDAMAAWATANGLTLPASPAKAILRQRGTAYVDGLYGDQFPGKRTGGYAQAEAWPRTDADFEGDAIPSDVVPAAIEQAAYWAGYYSTQRAAGLGGAYVPGEQVKRKKLEGLEKEYFEAAASLGARAGVPVFPEVEGLLYPFLIDADLAGVGLVFVV